MNRTDNFEKLFPTDILTKRERVERTLNHQPVDRAAIHEQLSLNPSVVALYTGKNTEGFNYTLEDIGTLTRKTVDMCFRPRAPLGKERYTDEYGFVFQKDNWTTWHISRPFTDAEGAKVWLEQCTKDIKNYDFDPDKSRQEYREGMLYIQKLVGETVILNCSTTGMCSVFDSMGLEIFTYFYYDYPEVMAAFMEASVALELERIHAIADKELSPVILIAEDFSTKQGPIFGPEFLELHHYSNLKRLCDAWHSHDIKVLYHSDGNYKKVIPELMKTGVDGFYCLEPNCGMDVVELKRQWPEMVWAGGVDGVDLMEYGSPEEVRKEVQRHILQSGVLQTGGMFVATSSEINPPIKAENFKAMVDTVGEIINKEFNFDIKKEGR